MIGQRRRPIVSALRVVLGPRRFEIPPICIAVILSFALLLAAGSPGSAQIRPEVRDRVVPAVVQIWVMAEVTERGVVRTEPVFSGSGTLISPTGQILTNWHVVDMAEHRSTLDAMEDEFAASGQPISARLLDDAVLVLTSNGESLPEPRYIAEVTASDALLDLAVLQIVGDGAGPIDRASLDLPFVPLGDSDAVNLGDPIDLFGFPWIGGGTLTYTSGVVSGFITDSVVGRVWVNTDATMASGSSGGTAINRAGELIGIPTQGTLSGCLPADMNLDGRIDARDEGCLVEPGSIGQLRPVNLALDLIEAPPGSDPRDGSDGAPQPSGDLLNRLPEFLPLDHASCFSIVDDRTENFDQALGRFSGVPDAADRLQAWGWQASAFRQFGCDGPPDGEAGWIDISVHLFADSAAAQEAVDYFTAVRLDGSPYIKGASPGIGDYSTAMSGPAVNGKDFTIYASQGPLLIRVTGVSPSGIPFMNVLTVAQAVLAAQQAEPQVDPTRPVQADWRSASTYLPVVPAVHYRECFDVLSEGTYAYSDVVEALLPTGLSQAQLDGFGWRDGAFIVFTCDEPPAGRATRIDVGIHQFQDAASARQALPYFSTMFDLGGTEHRDCDIASNLVVCVSARSLTGSPLSDVAFVLQQIVAAAR